MNKISNPNQSKIQINNLSAKIQANQLAISQALNEVIQSGFTILGPAVKNFESRFAEYIGTKHCISLANGTDAIELGLRSLGVKNQSIVATVANAGMYTTTATLAIGATPFFMDVDVASRNTTLSEVKRAIDAGVHAVVVTHLYGLPASDIQSIAAICSRSGVPLLEDCAQAHGAEIAGRKVGTFGDAASFSFYPTKNLGALGDGGAVTTNRSDIADRVSRLRQYGWGAKYHVEMAGARNSRLDEMQAAILSVFLPKLGEWNKRRQEIAARYYNEITHPDILSPNPADGNSVAHLYVIQSPNRDSLKDHLSNLGIASDIHYPIPDYRQALFEGRFSNVRLPNTEILCEQTLTIPCYPELSDQEVNQVIQAVNEWKK